LIPPPIGGFFDLIFGLHHSHAFFVFSFSQASNPAAIISPLFDSSPPPKFSRALSQCRFSLVRIELHFLVHLFHLGSSPPSRSSFNLHTVHILDMVAGRSGNLPVSAVCRTVPHSLFGSKTQLSSFDLLLPSHLLLYFGTYMFSVGVPAQRRSGPPPGTDFLIPFPLFHPSLFFSLSSPLGEVICNRSVV